MRDMRLTKTTAMLLAAIMVLSMAKHTVSAEETTVEWSADVVVYSIGNEGVSVGTEGMGTDYCFDENGNFEVQHFYGER